MTLFEEKFDLFLTFLSDINYFHRVKNLINNFPDVYKELLNDIVINTNIYKLIRANNLKHSKKIEEEKKKRIIRQKKKFFLK